MNEKDALNAVKNYYMAKSTETSTTDNKQIKSNERNKSEIPVIFEYIRQKKLKRGNTKGYSIYRLLNDEMWHFSRGAEQQTPKN